MGTWVNRVLRWLSWPSTPNNDLVPWYQIVWRIIFLPLIYVGIVIAFVGVLLAYGYKDASNFWDKTTTI